ncbi:minor tail protein [Hafnia phage yong3]|nr:minor tail protein [Hafnia phage yong3]
MLYSPFSDEMLDLMEQPNVNLVLATEIHFPSGITRVHTGTGTVVINGQAFLGVGVLGEVGSVTEENNTSPSSMSLTLSGLDLSLVATTLEENCVGSEVICYAVCLREDGTAGAANMLFQGFISDSALLAGSKNGLNYTVSNIFEKWSQGLPERYTDESHQASYPGDRFFRYIAQMAERSIYWGSKKDAPAFIYN